MMLSATTLGIIILLDNKEARLFNRFFENTKLYIQNDFKILMPKLIKKEIAEDYNIYKFKIPIGMSLNSFQEKKEALEHFLKGKCDLEADKNILHIKYYKDELPDKFDFDIQQIKENLLGQKLALSIGRSREGHIYNDFTSSACHMLVAGATDMGKSCFIRQLIASGIIAYSPNQLQFDAIDLKVVEMKMFRKSDHFRNIATNQQQALELVKKLNEEVDERMAILEHYNKTNIWELKRHFTKRILIVDEYAEIDDDRIKNGIDRLLRLARFCGIHVILATQRPTVDIVPGKSKANLIVRVAFKMSTQVDSKVILDNDAAAHLPKKAGRGIYKINENIEFQAPYIDTKTVKTIIEYNNIPKQSKPKMKQSEKPNKNVRKKVNRIC